MKYDFIYRYRHSQLTHTSYTFFKHLFSWSGIADGLLRFTRNDESLIFIPLHKVYIKILDSKT